MPNNDRNDFMDNRELKNILDENLKKIVDLWRSL